jgi:hypothetical protein
MSNNYSIYIDNFPILFVMLFLTIQDFSHHVIKVPITNCFFFDNYFLFLAFQKIINDISVFQLDMPARATRG